MTSLRVFAASGLVVGSLALAGCPGGDDTTDTGSMMTTGMSTGTSSGMESTTGSDPDDSGSDTMSMTSGDMLSHAADIQPIWQVHCIDACHVEGGEWSFLDLSDDEAYAAIVGVASMQSSLNFIEPGDAEMSYLWHKINGTQMTAGGGGLDMPKARPDMEPTVMTDEEKMMVMDWINSGAAE